MNGSTFVALCVDPTWLVVFSVVMVACWDVVSATCFNNYMQFQIGVVC